MRGFDPKKAGYKQENNMTRKLFEHLIPNFDRKILVDTIQGCRSIVEDADSFELASDPTEQETSTMMARWAIKGSYGEIGYYSLKFTAPMIQHINRGFAQIHFNQWYTESSKVEYIPGYIMNINHVALLKFHPRGGLHYDQIDRDVFNCFRFEGGQAMILSSDNILLERNAKSSIQGSNTDVIKKCLEYCYWRLPIPKHRREPSCSNNLIYHSNSKITAIVRLYKTMLRVLDIHRNETICIFSKKILECARVQAVILTDEDGRTISEKRDVFIVKNLMSNIKEDDLISVVIMQDSKSKHSSIVIDQIGDVIEPGNIKPILSFVLHERLQLQIESSLTYVGEIREIHGQVSDVIRRNSGSHKIFYPDYIWKITTNDIEKLIDELFPLYVRKNESVYQIPTALLSFLISSSQSLPSKKSILSMALMLDLITPYANCWKGDALASLDIKTPLISSGMSDTESLLMHLPMIVSQIVYSRILSKRPI